MLAYSLAKMKRFNAHLKGGVERHLARCQTSPNRTMGIWGFTQREHWANNGLEVATLNKSEEFDDDVIKHLFTPETMRQPKT